MDNASPDAKVTTTGTISMGTDTVDSKTYTIAGKKYARVTSIVQFSGLSTFPEMSEERRQYYFKRGTENHRRWEMVEMGTADGFDFDPVTDPYAPGHLKFLRDTGFKALPDGIEVRVKHDELCYAGRVDRIGIIQGRIVLIDYKTSTVGAGTSLQTALYLLAIPGYKFEEVERYGIAFTKDGDYKMSEKYPLSDKQDAIYYARKYQEAHI